MKMVVGVGDDESSSDALALGAAITRSQPGTEPVLVNIHPTDYEYISRAHVDFEWEEYLHGQGTKVVQEAREEMSERQGITDCETGVHGHRSSGHGLAEYADEHQCGSIVIGSAPGGSLGRFQIGSTSNQLLHGASVPVLLAPTGFRRREVDRIGRVVVAFADGREGKSALRRGAQLATSMGVPLLVLTILIRHRVYGSQLGADAEAEVLQETLKLLRKAQDEAIADVDTEGLVIQHHVAVGDMVSEAMNRMEWNSDDLLVVPSSRSILRRVFLGDMNYKMVRAATVATMVLPRHTD